MPIVSIALLFAGFWSRLSNSAWILEVLGGLAALAAVLYACRRGTLSTWIFACMMLGGFLGCEFPHVGIHLQVITLIFLRLIRCIIAPLIFGTLVVGISGHSDLRKIGRMGLKAFLFFEAVTTLALIIGLFAIRISQAGVGLHRPPQEVPATRVLQRHSPTDLILNVFPENLAKAVAEEQVLQVVVFALIFALALGMLPESKRFPLLAFFESLSEAMFKFTSIVMYLAPPAVGAAIAYTIAQAGVGAMINLLKLLATLYVALGAFVLLIVIPTLIIVRVPLGLFFHSIVEPAMIAFATSSSEAALPRAMEEMETIGVPRSVVAFVIPAGYSFNLAGSALYLSLAALFVAQAANVHLDWSKEILLLVVLMITSKGVAGVPRAALVILLATIGNFNLPVWPVYIILGIDALMDMGRTAVNVIANCLASVVVARWEGEFRIMGRESERIAGSPHSEQLSSITASAPE